MWARPNLSNAGIVFTNSIVTSGDSAITSTGPFPDAENCARFDVPSTTMAECFSGSIVLAQRDPGRAHACPPSKWPTGNVFYSTAAIGFVNYHNGVGGDYHLLPSSPAKGAASDGSDPGANVDAVLSAVSAVQ